MKPIKALDAAFLQLETDATPMHVGVLLVLEPRSAREGKTFFRRLKRQLASRLGDQEIFTKRVARLPFGLANPMWVRAAHVDLDYHVRRTVLPQPGSTHQLHECVSDLHALRMEVRRPLWELHIIEGLERGRLALYLKVHRAALDADAALGLLMSLADSAGPRRRAPPSPPGERPGAWQLLSAGLKHQAAQIALLPALASRLGGLMAGARQRRRAGRAALSAGMAQTPRTPLNVAITGERSFASVECRLWRVKAIARATETSVNDVVLAACAGALRRWLLLHDALPVQALKAAVPAAAAATDDAGHSVRRSFLSVNLHTDREDAHARLAAIHASALEAMDAAAQITAIVPDDLPSLGTPWLLGALALAVQRPAVLDRLPLPANVIISNVAGPPPALFVAGAHVLSYSPVSIPYHGCALSVAVASYEGKLFFGLTAARNALPDLRDLADGVRTEIDLLAMRPRGRERRKRQ